MFAPRIGFCETPLLCSVHWSTRCGFVPHSIIRIARTTNEDVAENDEDRRLAEKDVRCSARWPRPHPRLRGAFRNRHECGVVDAGRQAQNVMVGAVVPSSVDSSSPVLIAKILSFPVYPRFCTRGCGAAGARHSLRPLSSEGRTFR